MGFLPKMPFRGFWFQLQHKRELQRLVTQRTFSGFARFLCQKIIQNLRKRVPREISCYFSEALMRHASDLCNLTKYERFVCIFGRLRIHLHKRLSLWKNSGKFGWYRLPEYSKIIVSIEICLQLCEPKLLQLYFCADVNGDISSRTTEKVKITNTKATTNDEFL